MEGLHALVSDFVKRGVDYAQIPAAGAAGWHVCMHTACKHTPKCGCFVAFAKLITAQSINQMADLGFLRRLTWGFY